MTSFTCAFGYTSSGAVNPFYNCLPNTTLAGMWSSVVTYSCARERFVSYFMYNTVSIKQLYLYLFVIFVPNKALFQLELENCLRSIFSYIIRIYFAKTKQLLLDTVRLPLLQLWQMQTLQHLTRQYILARTTLAILDSNPPVRRRHTWLVTRAPRHQASGLSHIPAPVCVVWFLLCLCTLIQVHTI